MIKEKQNLHTHTSYCDGADTPKEVIKEALKRGFTAIGFSGHFDLITKHCENTDFFDQNYKEYKKAVTKAAESLAGKIPFFEVNTGAIARGYRKTPYPTEYILNLMRDLGFGVVVTSDCHNKAMLDCYFEEADKLLKKCGFNEKYILTNDGFKPVEI